MDRPGPLTGPDGLVRAVGDFVRRHRLGPDVVVGLSGGPDSLALTAAATRAGLDVEAVVVDHGLQTGSDEVAERAAAQARALGAAARVVGVVVDGDGGPEAAARRARYDAFGRVRDGRPVLLGHTLDDQAETVLLGLGRGSGARSLAAMAPWNSPWGRPLLGVRRAATVAACAAWDLDAWHDPHNDDPRFTRVRVRDEVMPLLDDVLAGGVAEALARTARLLRDDADALDGYAEALLRDAQSDPDDGRSLTVDVLAAAPSAVRTRALRRWMIAAGSAAPAHTVAAVEELITEWRGQGPVAVAGDRRGRVVVVRTAGRLETRVDPRRPRRTGSGDADA